MWLWYSMLTPPSAPKGAGCGAGVAAFAAGTPCSGSKGKVKCLHSPHLSFTFFAAAAIFRPTRHVANCRTRPTPLPLGGLCLPPCGRLGPALAASSPRCGQASTLPCRHEMLRKKYHVVRKKYHVVRKIFYVASIFDGAAGRESGARADKKRMPWKKLTTAG